MVHSQERTVASCQWPVASTSDALPGIDILALRLGLKYARGLREAAGQALVRERSLAPFASVQDLARRVPELRKDELTTLAEIGALNEVGNLPRRHGDTEKDKEKSIIDLN